MPQFLTDVIHVDATNVALGSTTGTKIGTATSQKLAFYNSTPIVQPSGNTLTALANLGLISAPTLSATNLPVFVASGASHAAGVVPDPGSTAGVGHFLREDATWAFADALMPLSQATVSITTGTSLSSTAWGRWHVCSGTSANYTVTLPSPTGNTGLFIGFLMAPGLTKLVTIARNAADFIDGATSHVLWANETAILLCDGTNWIKVAGKTIPMICEINRHAAFNLPYNAFTAIPCDTTKTDNTGLMADPTTNHRINIVRTSLYLCSGSMGLSPITNSPNTQATITRSSGTAIASAYTGTPSTAITVGLPLIGSASLAAGDWTVVNGYQSQSGATSCAVIIDDGTRINLTEIPQW